MMVPDTAAPLWLRVTDQRYGARLLAHGVPLFQLPAKFWISGAGVGGMGVAVGGTVVAVGGAVVAVGGTGVAVDPGGGVLVGALVAIA